MRLVLDMVVNHTPATPRASRSPTRVGSTIPRDMCASARRDLHDVYYCRLDHHPRLRARMRPECVAAYAVDARGENAVGSRANHLEPASTASAWTPRRQRHTPAYFHDSFFPVGARAALARRSVVSSPSILRDEEARRPCSCAVPRRRVRLGVPLSASIRRAVSTRSPRAARGRFRVRAGPSPTASPPSGSTARLLSLVLFADDHDRAALPTKPAGLRGSPRTTSAAGCFSRTTSCSQLPRHPAPSTTGDEASGMYGRRRFRNNRHDLPAWAMGMAAAGCARSPHPGISSCLGQRPTVVRSRGVQRLAQAAHRPCLRLRSRPASAYREPVATGRARRNYQRSVRGFR